MFMKFNKFLVFDMFSYYNPIVQEDIIGISKRIDWTAFKGQSILITGANGHIASYLAFSIAYAIREDLVDAQLYVLSRNKERLGNLYGDFQNFPWFHMVAADVCTLGLQELKFDYIFHLAGNASPYFIKSDPVGILRANLEGTFEICELARKKYGCKVIYASTREVYGKNNIDDKLSEYSFGFIDPLDSRSCYPESKRASETILEAYRCQYDISFSIARIAHCYGPGMKLENDGRVMSDFLNDALNGNDIIIKSDGMALRAFCYISDIVAGLLMIATINESGVYNLSNESEEITIKSLANLIAGYIGGISVQVNGDNFDTTLYCNYKRKPLDCSKIMERGWVATVGLNEGISRTVKSFRS